jgi:hypothetical protein
MFAIRYFADRFFPDNYFVHDAGQQAELVGIWQRVTTLEITNSRTELEAGNANVG